MIHLALIDHSSLWSSATLVTIQTIRFCPFPTGQDGNAGFARAKCAT